MSDTGPIRLADSAPAKVGHQATWGFDEHVEVVLVHFDGARQVQVVGDALQGVAVDEFARGQNLAEVASSGSVRLQHLGELAQLQEGHLDRDEEWLNSSSARAFRWT